MVRPGCRLMDDPRLRSSASAPSGAYFRTTAASFRTTALVQRRHASRFVLVPMCLFAPEPDVHITLVIVGRTVSRDNILTVVMDDRTSRELTGGKVLPA